MPLQKSYHQKALVVIIEQNPNLFLHYLERIDPQEVDNHWIKLAWRLSQGFEMVLTQYLFGPRCTDLVIPNLIATEIAKKLPPIWQLHLIKKNVAARQFTDDELRELRENFFLLRAEERPKVLLAILQNKPELVHAKTPQLLTVNIDLGQREALAGLRELLSAYENDLTLWKSSFNDIINNLTDIPALNTTKQLFSLLLSNSNLTQAKVSTLDWNNWLQHLYDHQYLDSKTLRTLRYLNFDIAQHVNHSAINKDFVSKLMQWGLTANSKGLTGGKKLEITRNQSMRITNELQMLNAFHLVLKKAIEPEKTFFDLVDTSNVERIHLSTARSHLVKIGLLSNDCVDPTLPRYAQAEDVIWCLSNYANPPAQTVRDFSDLKMRLAIPCLGKAFQANVAQASSYHPALAIQAYQQMIEQWLALGKKLKDQVGKIYFLQFGICLLMTWALTIPGFVWTFILMINTNYLYHPQTSTAYSVGFMATFGATMGAPIVAIFCFPFLSKLAISEYTYNAMIFNKLLQQFKNLTDKLIQITAALEAQNANVVFTDALVTFRQLDLSDQRLSLRHGQLRPPLIAIGWARTLRAELVPLFGKTPQTIENLTTTLDEEAIAWGNELDKYKPIRLIMEEQLPTFFNVKKEVAKLPVVESHDDDNDTYYSDERRLLEKV